jgi:hypothetical protein
MVLGGIMGDRKAELVIVGGNLTAQGYVHILANTLLPFMHAHRFGLTFQQYHTLPV